MPFLAAWGVSIQPVALAELVEASVCPSTGSGHGRAEQLRRGNHIKADRDDIISLVNGITLLGNHNKADRDDIILLGNGITPLGNRNKADGNDIILLGNGITPLGNRNKLDGDDSIS